VRRDPAGGRERGPRPLDSSLDEVSKRLGLEGSRGIGRIFASWPDAVGPAMAEHVQPIKLDGDVLVVAVDHPAWATQVRRLGDDLLDRVAERADVPRPARLEVRVRR
jgi:predicted nucleic acid-binding Zn ribbon protein